MRRCEAAQRRNRREGRRRVPRCWRGAGATHWMSVPPAVTSKAPEGHFVFDMMWSLSPNSSVRKLVSAVAKRE